MERLFNKAGEFYLCARHMHPRGCAAVIEECKPIVAQMKADGKTFEDVRLAVEKISGEPLNLEKDPFLNNIKGLFSALPTQATEERGCDPELAADGKCPCGGA